MLAIASTILIVAAQSTLLAALLYYVPLEFANMRLSGLLIIVGIGLVLGLYQIARHVWSAIRSAPLEVDGLSVLRVEQPGIWELATGIAHSLGAPPPDNILLGLEPNYFATESRISAYGVESDGYSLYISVPATRMMTKAELGAIIGHEFGHFRRADTTFTKRIFPALQLRREDAREHGKCPWILDAVTRHLHAALLSGQLRESTIGVEP